jgi:phage baseplate assembly protein W
MAVDFGLSWSCVDDLTMPSTMVSGFRCVAEAIVRRWGTPRGQLIGHPDYGTDISSAIGDDLDVAGLVQFSQSAAAEAKKDPRVRNCFVTINLISEVLIVKASVETANGPFTLVASVSKITVTLLEVSTQ